MISKFWFFFPFLKRHSKLETYRWKWRLGIAFARFRLIARLRFRSRTNYSGTMYFGTIYFGTVYCRTLYWRTMNLRTLDRRTLHGRRRTWRRTWRRTLRRLNDGCCRDCNFLGLFVSFVEKFIEAFDAIVVWKDADCEEGKGYQFHFCSILSSSVKILWQIKEKLLRPWDVFWKSWAEHFRKNEREESKLKLRKACPQLTK